MRFVGLQPLGCRAAPEVDVKQRKSGGVEPLNFSDELERERRRKSDDEASASAEQRRPARRRKDDSSEVGDALRTVYQRAIDEDIPPEMLDLLGKLG